MKNKLSGIACVAAAILFSAAGCTKEKNSSGIALFGLHLHTYIADSLVNPTDLNVYIPDSNGRVEKLSHAQFYMTNISLHSTTNGWYVIPNSLILKREDNEEYVLGTVPADNYDDVRFTVGLNPVLNGAAPSSYTSGGADTVLSTLEDSMWFGTTAQGYKFISVAGVVDTTANNSGLNTIPFSYDIGGTGDTVTVTMPAEAFTLLPNTVVPGTQLVHIVCDYGHLIQNVPIVTDPTSRTCSGTPQQSSLALKIWNNILTMFRYECTTPNGDC